MLWKDVDPPSLVALAILNLVGSILGSMTGFGTNIIFQLGWYMLSFIGLSSGSLKHSTLLLTLAGLPACIIQTFILRRHVNVSLTFLIGFFRCSFEFLGVAILANAENTHLQRVLGLILLGVFVWRTVLEQGINRGAPEKPFRVSDQQNCLVASSAAIFSGILGGMFGAGGPPMMVFVLIVNIDKDEWRGTTYAYTIGAELVRVSAFMSFRGAPQLQAASGLWLQVACILLGGVFGLYIGNVVSAHVSQEIFRHSLLIILFGGSLTLATSGMGKWSTALIIAVAFFALGGYAKYRRWAASTKQEQARQSAGGLESCPRDVQEQVQPVKLGLSEDDSPRADSQNALEDSEAELVALKRNYAFN